MPSQKTHISSVIDLKLGKDRLFKEKVDLIEADPDKMPDLTEEELRFVCHQASITLTRCVCALLRSKGVKPWQLG